MTFKLYLQVFEIPPITQCPTASNISFEEEGDFKVEESCSRLPCLSSVTRGVKSRPLEDAFYPRGNTEKNSLNVETVPLLSPKMESELLQESWALPQNTQEVTTAPSPVSFNWEENFQDLSRWCMDFPIPFQEACDFLIGEETDLKISDIKMEGNEVSIIQKGDVKEALGEESAELNLGDDTSSLRLSDRLVIPSTQQIKHQKLMQPQNVSYVPEEVNISDISLNLPSNTDFTSLVLPNIVAENVMQPPVTCNTNDSVEEHNTASDHASLANINLDEVYTGTFDDQDTWKEVVRPEKNAEFDLLSYVCDDKIYSAASDSTHSSMILKSDSVSTLDKTNSNKTRKIQPVRQRSKHYSVTSTSSSGSTSSLSSRLSSIPMTKTWQSFSKRTTRTSSRDKSFNERLVKETKESRRGKKRYTESDSEDAMSDYSYRESREKNNEASRKSRMNKKIKEREMNRKAMDLERDNNILRMKVEELEKLVASMRSALLNSALRKDL